MQIDPKTVGANIAELRNGKNLTQKDLAERLNISFQAVSKWERGESLPDITILADLAAILETSTDFILTGGRVTAKYKGKIRVADMREGLLSLAKVGQLLGKDNIIYRAALDGINTRMNTEIEGALEGNEMHMDAFIADALIWSLIAGFYVDPSDVRNNFHNERAAAAVLEYAARYGIE